MIEKFKNINILVVDDHYIMRKTIKDMIKMLGYNNITLAESGKEAFQIIEESYKNKTPIHLVISDWVMPDGLGIELIYNIKSSPVFFLIPTIMITGEMLKNQISQAVEYGADAYLLKPFKIPELDKVLDIILSKYAYPNEEQKKFFSADRLFLTGQYKLALPTLVEIYHQNPATRFAYRIIVCLHELGQHERALALLLSHKDCDYLPILREIINKNHDNRVISIDEEVEILRRMIPMEWKTETILDHLLRLADLYIIEKKELHLGFGVLLEAQNLDKKNIEIKNKIEELESRFSFLRESRDPSAKTDRLINKGIKYFNDIRVEMRRLKSAKKLDERIDDLNSKLEYVPKHSEWTFELGVALLENGKTVEGLDLIEQAIRMDESSYIPSELFVYINKIRESNEHSS